MVAQRGGALGEQQLGAVSPSAKQIRTAAGRALAGGCGKRGASRSAFTDAASSSTGFSQSGSVAELDPSSFTT